MITTIEYVLCYKEAFFYGFVFGSISTLFFLRDDMQDIFNLNPTNGSGILDLDFDEARMDIIGQNGNFGLHYEKIDLTDELVSSDLNCSNLMISDCY